MLPLSGLELVTPPPLDTLESEPDRLKDSPPSDTELRLLVREVLFFLTLPFPSVLEISLVLIEGELAPAVMFNR